MFTELLPHHVGAEEVARRKPKGLILSGGPASVYADGAPRLDKELLELGIPVLGICYGMQLLAARRSAARSRAPRSASSAARELTVHEHGRLLAGLPAEQTLLDDPPRHRLRAAARGSRALASSTASPVAAFESVERGIYGIQFHPEVVHTPYGQDVLKRFLGDVCGCDDDVERRVDRRGADRADPRPGRRRQGHLRPVRRRRLVGRRAARPPGDRRPADLRLRRPRPDAQERGRAGHRGLPRPLQGPARRRRRRGALPRQARRASPTPRPSAR